MNIFFSYTNQDRIWVDRLASRLKARAVHGCVDDDLEKAYLKQLKSVDLVVLMISAGYLKRSVDEVTRIRGFAQEMDIPLIPVIVRPTLWRSIPWLSSYEVLPRKQDSLMNEDESKEGTVLEDVVSEIGHVLEKKAYHVLETDREPEESPSKAILSHWFRINRRTRFLITIMAILSFGYQGWLMLSSKVCRDSLAQSNLPVNLSEYPIRELNLTAKGQPKPCWFGEELTTLRLSGDYNLDGKILPASLRRLELRGFEFSSLENFSHLQSLEELVIKHNSSFSSMKGIEHLSNLKKLHLENLESLDSLSIHEAHFLIQDLLLKKMNLTTIDSMPNLRRLTLDETGLEISAVEKLVASQKELRYLKLVHSRLVILDPLGGLTGLTELHLGGGKFKSLAALKKLTKLRVLSIRDCSELTTLEGLEDLLSLEELALSGTDFRGFQGLRTIPSLRSLTLTNTRLETLESIALLNLEEINLSHNPAMDLRGLDAMTQLKRVSLINNGNFSHFYLDLLNDLTQLEELRISSKEVHRLRELRSLRSLRTVAIILNHSTDFDEISQLHYLEDLTISGSVTSDDLARLDLPNLTRLSLQNNSELTELSSLRYFPNLSELELSNCRGVHDLRDIEVMRLTRLTLKGVDATSLKEVPPTLRSLTID